MLIEVDPLMDIIKLTLQTAYVKDLDTPTNLLIIAKPESGKTSAMTTFDIKGTFTTNNLTQAVIVSKFLPMIENQKLKHLIIPDIINCIGKDARTRKGFLNMVKTLIEEGITSLDTFHMRTNKVYNPPVKCGLITAITSDSYRGYYNSEKERWEGGVKQIWRKTGLLSRFMPFSYEYEFAKIRKIFKFIESEECGKSTFDGKIKRRTVVVKGNPLLFAQLEMLSTSIGKEVGGYGYSGVHYKSRCAFGFG